MSDARDMTIRPLRREDLAFAQEVRSLAGWNQTRTDWERLLACEPEGCFFLSLGGEPAGTATTTRHGSAVGWIGMVLVHPRFRRRGCATRLLRHCIDYLEPRVACIKLDATPDGRKVYEKLGFVAETELRRWEGDSSKSAIETPDGMPPFSIEDVEALDTRAFGANRTDYLRRLARDSKWAVSVPERGYALLRAGSRADYLGPVVAGDPDTARSLIHGSLAQAGDAPVFWDIPEPNRIAVHEAERLGFSPRRLLIRMRLGEAGYEGKLPLQWAIGAPETG